LRTRDPVIKINIEYCHNYSERNWDSSDDYSSRAPELYLSSPIRKSRHLEVSHVRKSFRISVDKDGNLSQSTEALYTISSISDNSTFFKSPMTEVTSQLFLGCMENAANETELLDYGITHVLSVIGPGPEFFQGIRHSYTLMDDNGRTELKEVIKKLWPIIEESQQKHRALFVYCLNGENASAALMLAILMESKGEKLSRAYKLLKSKRPIVSINECYAKQLLKMEQELFGANSVYINRSEEGYCNRNTRKSIIAYDCVSSTVSTSSAKSGNQKYNRSTTTGAVRSSAATRITYLEPKKSPVRKSSNDRIFFSQVEY